MLTSNSGCNIIIKRHKHKFCGVFHYDNLGTFATRFNIRYNWHNTE